MDLDGTLVEQGNRDNVNPQAPEALQRAEAICSVFIVTSGVFSIDGLRRLGLAGDRTVVITRKNYPQDAPDFALSEVQRYIAIQQSLGKSYHPSNFRLEDPAAKHLAPLFMEDHPIPLIDNTAYPLYRNPGIYGLMVNSYQRHKADYELYHNIIGNLIPIQSLRNTIKTVETFYSGDPREQAMRLQLATRTAFGVEFPEPNQQRYAAIALGIVDLFASKLGLWVERLQEITDYFGKIYLVKLSFQSAMLDGPVYQLNISTGQENWIISLASSPIMQGINHGFNWLTYGKYEAGKLVEYGFFNQGEAGRMTLGNSGAQYVVDVFQKFNDLIEKIL